MADEIKPPVSGSTISPPSQPTPSGIIPPKPSGPSPLTPDIKIPPNLPTGEIKPPVFSKPPMPPPEPSQVKPAEPTRPVMPMTQFSVPTTPPNPITHTDVRYGAKPSTTGPSVPPTPPLTPKPGLPVTIPTPNQPATFKSSIRTMQDDLASLKKGQPPAGFKIEKESEKEIKPTPQTTIPKITPPPSISHVELGKLEKSRPLTVEAQKGPETQKSAISVPPRLGLSKPTISIPSVGGILGRFGGLGSKKLLLIVAGLVIVVGIVIGFVVLRGPETPGTAITPTFTPRVPTTTSALLESLFSISDSVGISLGPDFNTRFIDSVKTDLLLSSREPGLYKITSTDGIKRYGFMEFLGGASVAVPDELKLLIDDGNLWLSLAYKSDNAASFGFVVRLLSPAKNNEAIIALQNWEGTLTQSLANLFRLDQTKAASVGFLDNTYNGTAVKYRNFPDTNSTIDYAVVRAKNGESYLIVVNSREHIYKIIDKLR